MLSLRLPLALLMAAIVLATAAPVATAATPPFDAPTSWSTMCTTTRQAGGPMRRGTNCRWLKLDGVWRRYLVYVPTNTRHPWRQAWPLVVMFHGSRRSGEAMWVQSGWRAVAERNGIVVAFPTAWSYLRPDGSQGTRWHTWATPTEIDADVRLDGYPATAPYPARDVTFVEKMVRDIENQISIDPARRFVSGGSNGGKFVQRVVIELTSLFAAASCSAWSDTPPAGEGSAGRRAAPSADAPLRIPMLYGVGTRDRLMLAWVRDTLGLDLDTVPLGWSDAAPVISPIVEATLGRLSLDPTRPVVREDGLRTIVRWDVTTTQDTGRNVLRLVILDGVSHVYPTVTNNRHGFGFAPMSWRFFVRNKRP